MKLKKYRIMIQFIDEKEFKFDTETEDIVNFVSELISKKWLTLVNADCCINTDKIMYIEYKEL